MAAVGQLIIGVENYAEVTSIGAVVDDARLRVNHRHGNALADDARVEYFHLGGRLIRYFPRHLKINLLLSIHVVDSEQRNQRTVDPHARRRGIEWGAAGRMSGSLRWRR